jgi:nucleoside-diphosphate-sugar epimerase
VLGGTGFIGRNLVKLLLDSGQCSYIRSIDKVFPQTAFLSTAHAAVYDSPNCQFMQGNLSSAASIAKCFTLDGGREFDYVFNCAAETKYGQEEAIYLEKLHDVCVKIGTEAVKHHPKKFVHLSTAQVYAAGKKPSKENAALDPWTILAKVHLKTEESMKGIAGLPLVILRPSTVYGPGDIQGIAPRIICAAVYKKLDEKMKFLWTGELRINIARP